MPLSHGLGIISYDAIFSNSLMPFNYLLSSLANGLEKLQTGSNRFYIYVLFNYSQEKMIFSICLSILIQTETNIVLNNSLH